MIGEIHKDIENVKRKVVRLNQRIFIKQMTVSLTLFIILINFIKKANYLVWLKTKKL